jgi:hypothetical protein
VVVKNNNREMGVSSSKHAEIAQLSASNVQPTVCSQAPEVVVSPTQTVPLGVAQAAGQMISAVPFVQAPNTMISPAVPYGQSLAGLPTAQVPNSYVLTTAGTRYQLAMGGAGNVVPAATRRHYGAPFPNC